MFTVSKFKFLLIISKFELYEFVGNLYNKFEYE